MTADRVVEKIPAFNRTTMFITCSQKPTNGPYTEPVGSSPKPHTRKIHFNTVLVATLLRL